VILKNSGPYKCSNKGNEEKAVKEICPNTIQNIRFKSAEC